MKIENEKAHVQLEKLHQRTQRETSAQTRQTPSSPGDSVELSTRAQDYSRIQEAMQNAPDIRQEKVERLQQQIADGTYAVDSGAVADRLIRESIIDVLA